MENTGSFQLFIYAFHVNRVLAPEMGFLWLINLYYYDELYFERCAVHS